MVPYKNEMLGKHVIAEWKVGGVFIPMCIFTETQSFTSEKLITSELSRAGNCGNPDAQSNDIRTLKGFVDKISGSTKFANDVTLGELDRLNRSDDLRQVRISYYTPTDNQKLGTLAFQRVGSGRFNLTSIGGDRGGVLSGNTEIVFDSVPLRTYFTTSLPDGTSWTASASGTSGDASDATADANVDDATGEFIVTGNVPVGPKVTYNANSATPSVYEIAFEAEVMASDSDYDIAIEAVCLDAAYAVVDTLRQTFPFTSDGVKKLRGASFCQPGALKVPEGCMEFPAGTERVRFMAATRFAGGSVTTRIISMAVGEVSQE